MYFQCSGESASSAGTEALTDPLEKMALDVGMLDRQYRKLMDRQKQAHIVVGGTYIHPVVCRAAAGTRVLASTRFQKRIDSYFITRVPVKFFFYATECISMVTQLVTRKICSNALLSRNIN